MALQLRPSPGERWLELGCGSGLISLCLARRGALVTAVDLDPLAVQNTRHNAQLWGQSLDLRQGDLFDPLRQTQASFDVVVANLPFWEGEPDAGFWSLAMRAGRDFSLLRRFSKEFKDFAPRALLGLSEAGGHWRGAEAALGGPTLLHRERVHGEWLRLVALRPLLLREAGGVREFAHRHFGQMFNSLERTSVFASAAVRVTENALGKPMPRAEKPGENIVEPLRYCFEMMQASAASNQAREAQRIRAEAAATVVRTEVEEQRESTKSWTVFIIAMVMLFGLVGVVTWLALSQK
jgi:SAM-dependent methyltransferase